MNPVILNLLSAVHHYYPIGLPGIYIKYPGYLECRSIVAQKIEDIQNKKDTSWSHLISDIRNSYRSATVSDLGYLQFPSFTAEIEIENYLQKGVQFKRSIILCVSLLTQYYTVFKKDSYLAQKFSNNTEGVFISPYTILHCTSDKQDKATNEILQLKQLVESQFVSYSFVDHRLLFEYKISGGNLFTDMEANPNKSHSFFEFLFSSELESYELIIME